MKKIIILITMFLCCLGLTNCGFVWKDAFGANIEGKTTIGVRVGTDSEFYEGVKEVPVGEKASVLITTNLKYDKQKKETCKIVVTIEKFDTVSYELSYSSGFVFISNDERTFECTCEVSRETGQIQNQIMLDFIAIEAGYAKIEVVAYNSLNFMVETVSAECNIMFN